MERRLLAKRPPNWGSLVKSAPDSQGLRELHQEPPSDPHPTPEVPSWPAQERAATQPLPLAMKILQNWGAGGCGCSCDPSGGAGLSWRKKTNFESSLGTGLDLKCQH